MLANNQKMNLLLIFGLSIKELSILIIAMIPLIIVFLLIISLDNNFR